MITRNICFQDMRMNRHSITGWGLTAKPEQRICITIIIQRIIVWISLSFWTILNSDVE